MATAGGVPSGQGGAGARADKANEVSIWAVPPGSKPTVHWRTGQNVHSLTFSKDGQRLLTVLGRSTVKLWDAETGKQLGQAQGHLVGRDSEILGPDGATILIAEGTRLLQRNLLSNHQVGPVLTHAGNILSAAFSSDGKKIVTSAADRTVRVWNAATGEPLTPFLRAGSRVTEARLSQDGRRLLVVSAEPLVRVYELTRHSEPTGEELPARIGSVLALGPDGRQQILKRGDGSLLLWDGHSGRPLKGEPGETPRANAPGSPGPVVWNRATFSRNGLWAATAGDRLIRIWDTVSARPVSPFLELQARPQQVTFTLAGPRRLLVLDEANGVHLWSVEGTLVSKAKLPAAVRAGLHQLSPDGRFVASVGPNRTIEVREMKTGQMLGPPRRGLSPISGLAFSDDGELLLAAFADGNVGLWQTVSGEPVQLSLQHSRPVTFAVFGPAPLHLLATAQDDGTARVWDPDSGLPVTPLLHHDGPVAEILFGGNGEVLLTRTASGTLRRWPLVPDQRPADDLIRLARALAGQRLYPGSGGLGPVELGSFKALWPQLRRDFPREFSAPD